MSRGERNNNPGNLEYGKYAISQGAVGSDGRFAIFSSMADGIAAQVNLLKNAYIAKGYDTPSKIINRYGNDPGPGDDLSVRNYIKYVAGKLGIGVNDKVNTDQTGVLASAMREFETGKKVADAMLPDFIDGGDMGNGILTPGKTLSGAGELLGVDMGRLVAIIVGVILVGLAIAAFVFTTDVKGAAIKAVT